MIKYSIALYFILSINVGFAQTINTKTKLDSLCGAKINLDKTGKLLPRYSPQNSSRSYSQVIKMTSEFVKDKRLIEKETGKDMLYTTCCFQGPHMKKSWKIEQGKSIGGTENANFDAEGWMHNPACVFAGMTQSLALDYFPFTGDVTYVTKVKEMLDYQLTHGTTPSNFVWANVPYASSNPFDSLYYGATKWENEGMRGDGLHGIEPDKIGELGYAYIKFYEITLDKKYLKAGLDCADGLAKFVKKDVLPGQNSLEPSTQTNRSPWPFRINARTGKTIDEYCSHVVEPIRLFDEILRIGAGISLDTGRIRQYTETSKLALEWLYSRNGPMKTYVWNAYFEDIPSDPKQANRNQVSPMETARYLINDPGKANNLEADIPALIYYVKSAFGTENIDAIKEQSWCFEPMASHTSRYASVCAMWYSRTNNSWFKEQALRHFNYATYAVEPSGAAWVGHTWPGSWWSDGYADYIKHFFDGMAAVPEWAPDNEDHLIKSSSAVQKISYNDKSIAYKTFDTYSKAVLRLKRRPKKVIANGRLLKLTNNLNEEGWLWKELTNGSGSVRINIDNGNEIIIEK
ncbi:MAG TPA: hypothetical protein VF691_17155 [Cytophagaceae bacterium]|jgi:hypothetical protein